MTNAQKTLFDSPESANRETADKSALPVMAPAGVPHNGTDTSREAARRISPLAGAQSAWLFFFVAQQGETGATDHEIQAALGLSGDTERPRRWSLVKAGLLQDSSQRRDSPSGRPATVYVATETGLSTSRTQAS